MDSENELRCNIGQSVTWRESESLATRTENRKEFINLKGVMGGLWGKGNKERRRGRGDKLPLATLVEKKVLNQDWTCKATE